MEIRKLILDAAFVALAATALFGQTNWRGIQPGVSKRADVERAAGAPVQAITDTLAEYKSTQPGDRVFVQYRATGVVERVEITCAAPLERAAALRTLGLSGNPEVTKPNARGKMEEFYGSAMMVLTLGDSGIARYAYYSKDLFEAAGGKIGAPRAPAVTISDDVRAPVRPPMNPPRVNGEPPTPPVGDNNQPSGRDLNRPETPALSGVVTIPAAIRIEVRLIDRLSTDKNKIGDKFRATLEAPLAVDGVIVAAKGADVEGRITTLIQSGRIKGQGEMQLELTSIRMANGQSAAIATSGFVQQANSTASGDAKKAGVGAGVGAGIGAAVGAVLGGRAGAAIGAGVGGAGTGAVILVKRGKPAELAVEAVLTFQLALPVTVAGGRGQ